MSARERTIRSLLNKLISGRAIARGNLVFREKVCGNPKCKCARGEKHPAVCLDIRHDGRHQQISIPQSFVEEIRCWVEQYQTMKTLLDELVQIYWAKIKKRRG